MHTLHLLHESEIFMWYSELGEVGNQLSCTDRITQWPSKSTVTMSVLSVHENGVHTCTWLNSLWINWHTNFQIGVLKCLHYSMHLCANATLGTLLIVPRFYEIDLLIFFDVLKVHTCVVEVEIELVKKNTLLNTCDATYTSSFNNLKLYSGTL